MYALCGAVLRLLGLGTESESHHFWCLIIKITKMPKPPQNTSVSSLSISLSLRDSLHVFFPCLSYKLSTSLWSCFCLHMLDLWACWQEKGPMFWRQMNFTPRVDLIYTWFTSLWCFNLFRLQYIFTASGRFWKWRFCCLTPKCVKTVWHSLYCLMWQTTLILYSKKG